MSVTYTFRALGPTVALSVGSTSSPVVGVNLFAGSSESCNYVALLNSGTTAVFVSIAGNGQPAPAAVVPLAGAPANVIALPPLMIEPLVWAAGAAPFSVAAIGAAAGPNTIFITPVQAG
jgi:hypothetical protein